MYDDAAFRKKKRIIFLNEGDVFRPSTPISKSLYEREASMNGYEEKMILEIASLPNIKFGTET